MSNVIIIGASSGIGKELAEQLLKSGNFVVLCARRADLLNELCINYPQNSMAIKLDVSDFEKVELILMEIVSRLGHIDLVIHSSGMGDFNPDLHFAIELKTIETNVIGFTAVTGLIFNLFQKQGFGHLAVISSIAGLRGGATAPAYNATKAYQINYAESLQIKAGKLGKPIFVTDVRPGFVDTAMAKGEGLFWVSSAPKAASQILRAISQKKRVVYITRRWRWIAAIFRKLPFVFIFKIVTKYEITI